MAPITNVQDVSIETLCSLNLRSEVVRQVSLWRGGLDFYVERKQLVLFGYWWKKSRISLGGEEGNLLKAESLRKASFFLSFFFFLEYMTHTDTLNILGSLEHRILSACPQGRKPGCDVRLTVQFRPTVEKMCSS